MKRAFTLLEILIATILFAMLMASYYTAFIQVIETEQFARESRHFGAIGPAILDLIEDDLVSLYVHPRAPDAFPLRGDDDTRGGKPADSLHFLTRRASIHQEEVENTGTYLRSPINEVGYRLAKADRDLGDVRRLYRREQYYVDGPPLQGGDYFEIYDRVVSLDIIYAGYRVEEDSTTSIQEREESRLEKFESWDSDERKGLPSAIFIILTIESPSLGKIQKDADPKDRKLETLVRVIRPPQAFDIKVPEGDGQGSDGTIPNPNQSPNQNQGSNGR